jgi:hypothetical protein
MPEEGADGDDVSELDLENGISRQLPKKWTFNYDSRLHIRRPNHIGHILERRRERCEVVILDIITRDIAWWHSRIMEVA